MNGAPLEERSSSCKVYRSFVRFRHHPLAFATTKHTRENCSRPGNQKSMGLPRAAFDEIKPSCAADSSPRASLLSARNCGGK